MRKLLPVHPSRLSSGARVLIRHRPVQVGLAALLIAVATDLYVCSAWKLPPLPIPAASGIQVFDRSGHLIGVLGGQRIETATELAPSFIAALIATEDRDFFAHSGVSWRGLLRAAWTNIATGAYTQGGSTLSMQTVRLLTQDRRPSLRRKIKEMVLARRLEERLSKEEILVHYANLCYLGEGQYGLRAASRHYFGADAGELTMAQAATLVAMLKAPNIYSRRNAARLKDRRDLVLGLIAEKGDLEENEYRHLMAQDLAWNPGNSGSQMPFFLDYVRTELHRLLDAPQWQRCAGIYTTLDLGAQKAARTAVAATLPQVDARLGMPPYGKTPFAEKRHYAQAAFIALDLADNGILAWIGGRDYAAAPFNATGGRTLARRQPGSAFKTFAYALAMARGIPPDRLLVDGPVSLIDALGRTWTPENYGAEYRGPTMLKLMLVQSLNSMAVRLVDAHLGPDSLAAFAHRCGILSPLPPYPSLALGAAEVTPMEMAAAYAVLARQGLTAGAPYAIRKVADRSGGILFAHSPPPTQPVLDPVSTFLVLDALKDAIDRGTGRRIRAVHRFADLAGKTGTSTAHRDAWFIGLTPRVACAAWIGFDDNRPMVDPHTKQTVVGGNSAALVASAFWHGYPSALADHFWRPPRDAIIWFRLNPRTGEPDGLNPQAVDVPYVLRSYLDAAGGELTSYFPARERVR